MTSILENKTLRLNFCLSLLVYIISMTAVYGQETEKKALLVIDVQENLVNPNSAIHIDTAGINIFFDNLNRNIANFNNKGELVLYVVNEWDNIFVNLATRDVCKKMVKA